jgi:dimethylhistidine N-methyltransferase
MAEQIRHHLTRRPRQLPSRYFYDALGSSLFDAICHLPWYAPTRAELGLIRQHRQQILARAGHPRRIIELGCGSGEKVTALLSDGHSNVLRSGSNSPRILHLIDASPTALDAAVRRLRDVEGVMTVAHEAGYEVGLARAVPNGSDDLRTLVLFLGSNIGNFEPREAVRLLGSIRSALRDGDRLLLGVDLVKPEAELLLAYDDPLGVTAAFNKNLLLRINRELDANFDIARFGHRACWNADESRVEMHLLSRGRQRVRIAAADLLIEIGDGETLWTESSYKFQPDGVDRLARTAGFEPLQSWIDERARFMLALFES